MKIYNCVGVVCVHLSIHNTTQQTYNEEAVKPNRDRGKQNVSSFIYCITGENCEITRSCFAIDICVLPGQQTSNIES